MTTERIIGALQADMENVKEDVAYIRQHMVTRSEFERTASEHRGFRQDIDSLLLSRERTSLLVKWGKRLLWVCLCVGTAAVFGVSI